MVRKVIYGGNKKEATQQNSEKWKVNGGLVVGFTEQSV